MRRSILILPFVVGLSTALFSTIVRTAGQAAAAPAWNPPHTTDGQPDIQGFWFAEPGSVAFTHNIETGLDPNHQKMAGFNFKERSLVIDPPHGKIPYQPWAAAKRNAYYDVRENPPTPADFDPVAQCLLTGVPRIHYQPGGFQIIQFPGSILFLAEFEHAYRIVPLDGRTHLGESIRLWMGDSRGKWERNTLVIDVTNRNGRTWFDWSGNFQSETLHMVERWTLVEMDTIRYEATLEDTNVYTRPWTIAFSLLRNKEPDYELLEDACYEGNRTRFNAK